MIDCLRTISLASVDMPQIQPTLLDKISMDATLPKSSIRTFCVFVSEELEPIETLQSVEFLKAFFQIEKGHYEMWNVGIRHDDLSLANFVYRVVGEQRIGVLSDWDLQITTDENDMHNGLERTGTVPYMSLDLLQSDAWSGNVQHLYRHDLEAILWILVWTIFCYENGRRKIPTIMRGWLTGDHSVVSKEKSWFLMHLKKVQPPPPSRAQEWILMQALLRDLILTRLQRQFLKMSAEDEGVSEKDAMEVSRLHWEVIEQSRLAGPLKEVVLAFKPQSRRCSL